MQLDIKEKFTNLHPTQLWYAYIMNTYSNKITPLQANLIKNHLEKMGADFDTVQYSVWRGKTKDFQAIYYTSGKFLIQGKDVSSIVEEIETLIGIKTVQKNGSKTDEDSPKFDVYIGTDESGKGDFFGPLVVAGVQVTPDNKQKFIDLGIKDSKKLDDAKIKKLAAAIRNNSIHSVVVMTPAKYNELYDNFKNLNKLLAWGHARAIENILEKNPCQYALSDKFGDESLIKNALMKNGRSITLDQRVRAESDIAVAAASIIARAEYVKRMEELEKKFNITLPKGASNRVVEQGKSFVQKYSKDELKEVAKLHFKTTLEVTK